jgi:L,D-transpeptidase YcbB
VLRSRTSKHLGSAALKAALLVGVLALATSPAPAPPLGQETGASLAGPAQAGGWTRSMLTDLLAAVEEARAEGLEPADYRSTELRRVLADDFGSEADRLAQNTALALAHDFAHGRVTGRARFDWFVASSAPAPETLRKELDQALAQGRVRDWLRSLLPTDPRYAALKKALAAVAPDDPRRPAILANMERWRWMPRGTAGDRYLWVNVPSFRVALLENGVEQASFVAVVGAPDTPTPALSSTARSVVVNPWWNVPRSIVASGEVKPGARAARQGFEFIANGRVRQRPGPANALGRIKIELPNPHAIYLHDTPAKALFTAKDRARSHGCIRVQDIEGLADRLAAEPAAVFDALAGEDTRTIPVEQSWPIWIVYFTLDLDAQGQLVSYPDIYGRDAALVAALRGLPPTDPPRSRNVENLVLAKSNPRGRLVAQARVQAPTAVRPTQSDADPIETAEPVPEEVAPPPITELPEHEVQPAPEFQPLGDKEPS